MSDNGSGGLPKARLITAAPAVAPRRPPNLRHGFYAPRSELTPEQEEVVEAILDLPHLSEGDRLAAEEVARLLAADACPPGRRSSPRSWPRNQPG